MLVAKVAGSAVGAVAGAVVPALGRAVPLGLLGLAGLGALGYLAPNIVLANAVQRRRPASARACQTRSICSPFVSRPAWASTLRSPRVSRNTTGPLADELYRTLQEVQLGRGRNEAMRNLAARCDVPELSAFMLAMVQADVFGVSVANVLRVQAAEMRVKRRQLAEERAMKIPIKVLFPVLFCIFPALFVVILGPAIMRIAAVFAR